MPVNQLRTPALPDPPAPEARLYLREDELDKTTDLLFAATRRFWRAAEPSLSSHDLGPAHYRALAAIRRAEDAGRPLSVGSLQARLGVRKQSLARVLREAEAAGLLLRGPGAHDRRQRVLGLTPAGQAAELAASAVLRTRLAAVFRKVGPEAVAGFRATLTALLAEEAPTPLTPQPPNETPP